MSKNKIAAELPSPTLAQRLAYLSDSTLINLAASLSTRVTPRLLRDALRAEMVRRKL